MRSRKAAVNTLFSLVDEVVSIVCSFILPRLILVAYGSTYNGLIVSITQFLACAVLLRSGIGGATRAALYKPLSENNQNQINAIVRATDLFMKRIGLILGGLILIFAALYPSLVKNEFEWFFTFSLFLIIGASTFAESFFGITYLIVLQADQRVWVSSLIRSICTVLNTVLGAVLIIHGAAIHVVKAFNALVFVLYPIALSVYVKKHYHISKNVEPNNTAIAQRWDAFWQQVGVFVMNNTDVMVLTVFSTMAEVSVYSVYNMVGNGLKRGIQAFSEGVEAAFGNMIAKNEQSTLRENVQAVENTLFGLSTVVYTCGAVMILSFVKLYTKNVQDINYIRPLFAYILILAQFFNSIRLPYQLVVQAAGHYKQTKKGAIIEPIINIALSVILVIKIGLVGVAVGTLAATVFRTIQYSRYMRIHLVTRSWTVTPFRILASITESILSIIVISAIHFAEPANFGMWVIHAIITGCICMLFVIGGSFILFPNDSRLVLQKIKAILR